MEERVYLPGSRAAVPSVVLREMWRDLIASGELVRQLVLRDIREQYRKSIFGFLWAFLPAIALTVLFTLASNSRAIQIGDTGLPYPLYVLFSMTLWQAFLDSLLGPLQALAAERSLLTKTSISAETPALARTGVALANLGAKLILVGALFAWYRVPVSPRVVLAAIPMILLVAFGLGLGLFLAPFDALYHDVSKGLNVVISFWFFLTPVVFPVPSSGSFRILVRLNPVTPLLVSTRELTIGVPLSHTAGFLTMAALTPLLLLLSWFGFRLALPYIAERLNA